MVKRIHLTFGGLARDGSRERYHVPDAPIGPISSVKGW